MNQPKQEYIEASLIKSTPSGEKAPPALYHVIVETTDKEEDIYLLLPMASRMMPLNSVHDEYRFASLKELASAIAALHENTSVNAAEPHLFIPGDNQIRNLTISEIKEVRKLLNDI